MQLRSSTLQLERKFQHYSSAKAFYVSTLFPRMYARSLHRSFRILDIDKKAKNSGYPEYTRAY
jgi:hypothetical protein